MSRYSLNDIDYNPEPVTLFQAGEAVDTDWDEDAALECSRVLRERDEQLLREFRERTKNLVASGQEK